VYTAHTAHLHAVLRHVHVHGGVLAMLTLHNARIAGGDDADDGETRGTVCVGCVWFACVCMCVCVCLSLVCVCMCVFVGERVCVSFAC